MSVRLGAAKSVLDRSLTPLALTLLASLPPLVWFAGFKPGIMTADSLSSWHQTLTGEIEDIQPPIFTWSMWLSRLVVNSPSLLTLAQIALLASGVVAVSRAIVRLGARPLVVWFAAGLLMASPMVGAFSVSVWKDISYSGVLLHSAAVLCKIIIAQESGDTQQVRRYLLIFGVLGGLLSILRLNGAIVVLGALVLLGICLRKHWKTAVAAAALTLAMLFATRSVVYPAADVSPTPEWGTAATFYHDIAAVLHHHSPETFDSDDASHLTRIGTFDQWNQRYHCSTLDSLYYGDQLLDFRNSGNDSRRAIQIWLRALLEHPGTVLGNRLCASESAWRPDGTDVFYYTVSGGVDPNPWGLHTAPVSESLNEALLDMLRWVNEPHRQWYLWRAPTYIYASYAVLAWVAVRRRRPMVLLAAIPLVTHQAAFMLASVAQDARYMFPALMLAVLYLPLMTAANRGDNLPSPVHDSATEVPEHVDPENAVSSRLDTSDDGARL